MTDLLTDNLAKLSISHGGKLYPLNIDMSTMANLTLTNPSVIILNDKVLTNLRVTDYALFQSTSKQYKLHGLFVCDESNKHINTINVICELTDVYKITTQHLVETSKFDTPPLWVYTGLEDARLVYWDNRLYLAGVRRDATSNGLGRIELSEIALNETSATEINRIQLSSPDNSYCEKNWMPVLDMPYHFIRWTNPTELVEVDPATGRTVVKPLEPHSRVSKITDLRGGSQIVPWNKQYISVTHEAQKINDITQYLHRIVLWDSNFSLLAITKPFMLMNGTIEFCCGLAYNSGAFLLTFGFQDNAAFLLQVPETLVKQILKANI